MVNSPSMRSWLSHILLYQSTPAKVEMVRLAKNKPTAMFKILGRRPYIFLCAPRSNKYAPSIRALMILKYKILGTMKGKT